MVSRFNCTKSSFIHCWTSKNGIWYSIEYALNSPLRFVNFTSRPLSESLLNMFWNERVFDVSLTIFWLNLVCNPVLLSGAILAE